MTKQPMPIATLIRLAANSPTGKERHDTALDAWEASIKLAATAGPGLDPQRLQRPSLGHWAGELSTDDKRHRTPALLAVQSLFVREVSGKETAAKSITARQLVDSAVAYRNVVKGHGATRESTFYDRAGDALLEGLDAAWSDGVFLSDDYSLRFVASIQIAPSGARVGRVLDLTGPVSTVLEPRGSTAIPADVLPGRLYVCRDDHYRSIHPWLLLRYVDRREQILFFNGRKGSSAKYLDYSGGDAPTGSDLEKAFPDIRTDINAIFGTSGGDVGQTDAHRVVQAAELKAHAGRRMLTLVVALLCATVAVWILSTLKDEPERPTRPHPSAVQPTITAPRQIDTSTSVAQPRAKPRPPAAPEREARRAQAESTSAASKRAGARARRVRTQKSRKPASAPAPTKPRGPVVAVSLKAVSGMPRGAAVPVMSALKSTIRRCYRKSHTEPDSYRHLTLYVFVGQEGRVTKTSVRPKDGRSKTFHTCVSPKAYASRFPNLEGAEFGMVTYSITGKAAP